MAMVMAIPIQNAHPGIYFSFFLSDGHVEKVEESACFVIGALRLFIGDAVKGEVWVWD